MQATILGSNVSGIRTHIAMGASQDVDLGFSLEQNERHRRVALLLHDYNNLSIHRRTRRLRRGIAVCDFIIIGLCIGGLAIWALFVWHFLHNS